MNREERETIIHLDHYSKTASIYSTQPHTIHKLKKAGWSITLSDQHGYEFQAPIANLRFTALSNQQVEVRRAAGRKNAANLKYPPKLDGK